MVEAYVEVFAVRGAIFDGSGWRPELQSGKSLARVLDAVLQGLLELNADLVSRRADLEQRLAVLFKKRVRRGEHDLAM